MSLSWTVSKILRYIGRKNVDFNLRHMYLAFHWGGGVTPIEFAEIVGARKLESLR